MKKIFLIVLCFLAISLPKCDYNRGRISIVLIKALDYADTLKLDDSTAIDKSDYFLVRNFSDNKKNEEYIDSFAKARKEAVFEKSTNYAIQFYFYKESSVTNIPNLKADPEILDSYSQQQDLIYWYSWQNGKFFGKFRFKDGLMINHKLKNISIEDVPINE